MAQIYVSIGTNIERNKHLEMAISELYHHFGALQVSPVYQSEAVGFEGDDFYNMVVGFHSDWTIPDLITLFKSLEVKAGRDHSAPKFSARTLDIDLLSYGDMVCQSPIVLPREEILHDAFVLLPLFDVAGDWIHPRQKKSVAELWQAFEQSSHQLERIADPIDMSKFKQW
ncbi:2-amino-4-hydroxy-6-hydroxymethyldihydropteridine diphosphokinase [Coleofasciculus sp. F4-SAH-05]